VQYNKNLEFFGMMQMNSPTKKWEANLKTTAWERVNDWTRATEAEQHLNVRRGRYSTMKAHEIPHLNL
jgi:hypothetical protein